MHSRTWSPTLACCATLLATGCGPALVATKGVVKLDGNPVEGATVTFVSESGTETYAGTTDSKGEFTLLASNQKSGAKAGTYTVTVVKSANRGEPMEPNSPDAMKAMKAEVKPDPKAGGPKGPKMPMVPGGGPGGGPVMMAPGVRSELPAVYASATTTPFKGIKVPAPDDQPIVLDLKSKP